MSGRIYKISADQPIRIVVRTEDGAAAVVIGYVDEVESEPQVMGYVGRFVNTLSVRGSAVPLIEGPR